MVYGPMVPFLPFVSFCKNLMLPSISSSATATAGILVALITGLAAIAKKYIGRKSPPKPEYITRAEFHSGVDSVRDRIGASYLALADKIEQQHNQVLTTLDRQGANFEARLDALESAVARLDERTQSSFFPIIQKSSNPLIHTPPSPASEF
jgi:hypothetical protein